MDWDEKKKDIINRLNSFERGYRGLDLFFYYEPYSLQRIDKNGNKYNPPSLDNIKMAMRDLYFESSKDNFRWEFCNIHVYKDTFDEEFNKYTKDLLGAERTDFIDKEIKSIEKQGLFFQGHRLYDICDKETYQIIKLSQSQKFRFLKLYLDEEFNREKRGLIDSLSTPDNIIKWHPEVFETKEAFNLFEAFISPSVGDKNGWLRDCSFIYREMKDREKPALIKTVIGPARYKEWFSETYPNYFPITEIKTYAVSHSSEREKRYKQLRKQHL